MILKLNDTGSLVEALQLGLSRSGYLSGEIDGIFGEKTHRAVFEFQKAFDIKADGIAGNKTLEYIERFIKGYYIKTIKKGDTLWNIALMTGTELNSILTANPDINPDALLPGSEITVPFAFPVVPTNISYSYYLTTLLIDGIKKRYPFIDTFTECNSVMGKKLEVLKIGKGKNHLFINAGFHANEWLNIPLVLKYAEEYLDAFIKNKPLFGEDPKKLYDSVTLHIMPLVNPDGLDIVTKALKDGNFFEKAKEISQNYPFVPFPEGWKANINGVDLNLQYPANWEKAREIKFNMGFTSPSPIEYVGIKPLSEPEAVCVYNYTLKNDFRMILAYHSQGNIIYWKYLDYLPPESERIGNILSDASGYPLEITPADSSFAGYKDWFISQYNRPGYTIETGTGKNPLPLSQFDDIYNANKKLLTEAIKETANL